MALKTKVKGTNFTIDQLVWDPDNCPAAEEHWCACTWASQYVGIDARHPAAQAYYNSEIDLYADWGLCVNCRLSTMSSSACEYFLRSVAWILPNV